MALTLACFLQNCTKTKQNKDGQKPHNSIYTESLHLSAKQLFGQILNLFRLQTNQKFSSTLHLNKMSYIG